MRSEVGDVRLSGSCWRIVSHFAPSCSQYSVSQKETARRSDELHIHALLSCGSVSFSLIAFRVLWKRKSAGNGRAMLWSVKGSIQSVMHLLTPFFSSIKQPQQALNTDSLIYHMLSQSSSWMPCLITADNKTHLLICFHLVFLFFYFLQKAASGCATNVQSSAFLGTRLAHVKQTSMLARANQAVSCHIAWMWHRFSDAIYLSLLGCCCMVCL
jgi:hypothetical protein